MWLVSWDKIILGRFIKCSGSEDLFNILSNAKLDTIKVCMLQMRQLQHRDVSVISKLHIV